MTSYGMEITYSCTSPLAAYISTVFSSWKLNDAGHNCDLIIPIKLLERDTRNNQESTLGSQELNKGL